MFDDYIVVFWIAVIIITSISSLFLIKNYVTTHNKKYILFYALIYPIYLFAYIELLKKEDLLKIYPFIKMVTVVLVVLIGVIIYEEEYDWRLLIGLLFGIIAIYYLSTRNNKKK